MELPMNKNITGPALKNFMVQLNNLAHSDKSSVFHKNSIVDPSNQELDAQFRWLIRTYSTAMYEKYSQYIAAQKNLGITLNTIVDLGRQAMSESDLNSGNALLTATNRGLQEAAVEEVVAQTQRFFAESWAFQTRDKLPEVIEVEKQRMGLFLDKHSSPGDMSLAYLKLRNAYEARDDKTPIVHDDVQTKLFNYIRNRISTGVKQKMREAGNTHTGEVLKQEVRNEVNKLLKTVAKKYGFDIKLTQEHGSRPSPG